jgi:serine/threonine protein phosphatase PrpC
MQIFAKTDIGKERKINEDFFYISDMKDEIQLAILADGMGGYNAGEVASKTATQAVKEYIQKHFSKDDIEETIRQAIEYANRVVYDKAKKQKELDGMGTTLDVCLIYNNKVYIGHTGDSRVYKIKHNEMQKITRDDSYVQTLIEDGTITKEEAFNHPKKNMITKALGCMGDVVPNIYVENFEEKDIILMTSDGLTNMVKEDEILKIINENPEEAVDKLIKKANDNGGYDNITVVIIL